MGYLHSAQTRWLGRLTALTAVFFLSFMGVATLARGRPGPDARYVAASDSASRSTRTDGPARGKRFPVSTSAAARQAVARPKTPLAQRAADKKHAAAKKRAAAKRRAIAKKRAAAKRRAMAKKRLAAKKKAVARGNTIVTVSPIATSTPAARAPSTPAFTNSETTTSAVATLQAPTATTGSTTSTTTDPPATTPTTTPTVGNDGPEDTKTECVYPSKHISLLQQFDQLVGTNVNCVMVFNDASTTWSSWDTPWFLNTYSDMEWGKWGTTVGTNRQLVITQNLFPASENSADWLEEGADGDFEQYAVTLAQNLVSAGLGSSIIRLAHEANGTWYPDSIPDTTTGDEEWVQFWDNTVTAMRSVPGANFQFDWTVNAAYRDIPLADFYPGDSYVDIIGVDVYDVGDTSQNDRWQHFYTEPLGVEAVEQFAAAHDKPLSIPEWGIDPAISPSEEGGGDDAGFIEGLASFIADNDVAYQSYFFSGDEMMQLQHSPQSIAAYASAFDANGYAVNSADESLSPPTATTAPSLALTGGPAFGSTVDTTAVTFTFKAAAGDTSLCSLDQEAPRACSSSSSDVLTGLSSGYHEWSVQLQDPNEQTSVVQTDFIVASSGS